MKINKFYYFLFIFILMFCFFIKFENNIYYAQADLSSSAKSSIVLNAESGRVFFEKNADEPLAIASTTKIVTALTVLENCENLDKSHKVPRQAVGIEGTSIYLKNDEMLTIRDLLYGMMLTSGNDSAMALALIVGGDINNFCKLMAKTTAASGADVFSFKNPHGLDEDGHYMSARSLALITAKALENETFYKICSTENYKTSSGNSPRYLKNKNKLLSTFDNCIGVKTGYTRNAGRCFVSAARKNKMTTISVVLNCGPMFEECSRMMQCVMDTYKMFTVLPAYNYQTKVRIENGKNNSVGVFSIKQFIYPLTTEEYFKLVYDIQLPESISAPIKKEQIVGKIDIYLDNDLLFSENLYTIESVKSISYYQSLKDIAELW